MIPVAHPADTSILGKPRASGDDPGPFIVVYVPKE